MQKAVEHLKFAHLMLNLKKIITLILTVAFFYSAVGHAFVLHYCNASETACTETSCCNEEDEPSCCDEAQTSANCCTISSEYLVNPFSVRQPVGFEIKKLDILSEPVFLFANESSFVFTNPFHTPFIKAFIPPDKDYLSNYHFLLI